MQKLIKKPLNLLLLSIIGISLYACDASNNQTTPATTTADSTPSPSSSESVVPLKTGNLLYIIRDVADMQLKTGDYLAQLKQSQASLQQAIQDQDQPQLQQTITTLSQQLKQLDRALNGLNLKSQEVENIRQQVLQVSQQALSTPLFNGQTDLTKVDFKQVQQQLTHIQTDMLQLASLVIPSTENDQDIPASTNRSS